MKRYLFAVLVLISLQVSSACSIAVSSELHITQVSPTVENGVVQFTFSDSDRKYSDKMYYSFVDNIEVAEYEVDRSEIGLLKASDYIGTIVNNSLILKKNGVIKFERKLAIDANENDRYSFFVDHDLNRLIFSIIHNATTYSTIYSFTDDSFEKTITSPFNFLYPLYFLGNEELNIIYSLYGGGLCVDGQYFSYTEDGMKSITFMNTGDAGYLNVKENKLTMNRLASYETNVSRVDQYDLESGDVKSLSLDSKQIEEFMRVRTGTINFIFPALFLLVLPIIRKYRK